jgi:hypothetical protein
MTDTTSRLDTLGAYGFDEQELVILAALVTGSARPGPSALQREGVWNREALQWWPNGHRLEAGALIRRVR